MVCGQERGLCMAAHCCKDHVHLRKGSPCLAQFPIDLTIADSDIEADRPHPNELQQPLKAPLRRLVIFALENSCQQFAQHRSAGGKYHSLPVELLNPITDHGDSADGITEMVRIEQIPSH